MPAFAAHAPGKIILFGEHAVVYGRPAIAAPVTKVQARVAVQAEPLGTPGAIHLIAPAIGLDSTLSNLLPEQPLHQAIAVFLENFGLKRLPACTIRISSTIPVASGMGSGAAVSVALFRALSAFIGHPLPNETISQLAFRIEKIYHGTPSGIDNSVITFEQPIYFIKEEPLQFISVNHPFTLIIGNTGEPSPTLSAVDDVRQGWLNDNSHYERIFNQIGEIAQTARQVIETDNPNTLGVLMNDNHRLLQELEVSSVKLDCLVDAARMAGALGAKLSGAGRGGNMISLVENERAKEVEIALQKAGAVNTMLTEVGHE